MELHVDVKGDTKAEILAKLAAALAAMLKDVPGHPDPKLPGVTIYWGGGGGP